ncbi:hypothetical protein [Bacillus pakistanensis]|nr:hypothetical protein [Bacillus pakistanensis]
MLKRASRFRSVPGHGPDILKMSDDELERYVSILEATFEEAFKEEEE